MNDIIVGQPLAWDVYDARNNLLLKRGHLIERAQQIEALVERGLFVDAQQMRPKDDAPPQKPKEIPSALRLRHLAVKRLEKLLFGLHTETDAQGKFAEVAKAVEYMVNINPDVALGSILLDQSAGNYSVRHSVDTAIVALIVARAQKKPAEHAHSIVCASLTMNVGMLRYQEQFQDKAEALSDKEKEIIRSHPEEGVQLLRQAGITDEEWLSCVLLHHENEDGTGYPRGLNGQQMPENAKIVAIADRYCARVSSRNYRKPLLPNAALRDILIADKKTIDPMMAAAFIRELGVFPTGTYVRLENGEIGVVTGKGTTTTTPVVHALVGPRGAPLSFPIKRDSSKSLYGIRDVMHESDAAVRVSMQQIWGPEAAA